MSYLERPIKADPPLPVRVPPGTSGEWRVVHFSLTEAQARQETESVRLRQMWDGQTPSPLYDIGPGQFVRLMNGRNVVMSNTSLEVKTHKAMLRAAKGHVLVAGLGIGMATDALLQNPAVTRITVLEKSADVLALTAPIYAGEPRVEIVHADVLTWNPPAGVRFDLAWFDIWPDIGSDNLVEMGALRRRYEPIVTQAMCWAEIECTKQAILLNDHESIEKRKRALIRSLPKLGGQITPRRVPAAKPSTCDLRI